MTQEETDHLMQRATSCVDGECSLDDVGDLLELLKAQQKQLSDRLDEVRSMIGVSANGALHHGGVTRPEPL